MSVSPMPNGGLIGIGFGSGGRGRGPWGPGRVMGLGGRPGFFWNEGKG